MATAYSELQASSVISVWMQELPFIKALARIRNDALGWDPFKDRLEHVSVWPPQNYCLLAHTRNGWSEWVWIQAGVIQPVARYWRISGSEADTSLLGPRDQTRRVGGPFLE